jgi:hypothetical protein
MVGHALRIAVHLRDATAEGGMDEGPQADVELRKEAKGLK